MVLLQEERLMHDQTFVIAWTITRVNRPCYTSQPRGFNLKDFGCMFLYLFGLRFVSLFWFFVHIQNMDRNIRLWEIEILKFTIPLKKGLSWKRLWSTVLLQEQIIGFFFRAVDARLNLWDCMNHRCESPSTHRNHVVLI